MKIDRKLVLEEAQRCWLCKDPVCAKACKFKLRPDRMLRSLQMGN